MFGYTILGFGSGPAAAEAGALYGNRGLFCGGSGAVIEDTLDYIAIDSTGNASDFGDLTVARSGLAAVSGD